MHIQIVLPFTNDTGHICILTINECNKIYSAASHKNGDHGNKTNEQVDRQKGVYWHTAAQCKHKRLACN